MKTIYKWYCKIETYLVAAGFFAIVALTFVNAVLRIFNKPIIATDDICSLLFAWVSFMGADVAMRSDRLVGMNIITMKLPMKAQKCIAIGVRVFMIAILSFFIVKGVKLANMNWARAFNTLSGVSYGWVTLSLPVCSAQMVLTCVLKLIAAFRNFGDDSVIEGSILVKEEVTA